MSAPPNSMIVKMGREDVHDNLVSIVESMERIRQEGISSLGSNDEQKMDYLRLTGELASCLGAFIKKNELDAHLKTVKGLLDDALLRFYDPLQQDFWDAREPMLKMALQDASVVLLGDDFVSESQAYHVFQGLKYLCIDGKDDKDGVYGSILPVNGLLNGEFSPEINYYLVKKMMIFTGSGVRADLNIESMVRGFAEIGALYVDLPKELYTQMKKVFPKTIMIEEVGKKNTRVIFELKEFEQGFNAFGLFNGYASLNLGDAEESLVKKTLNLYGFGKNFVELMKSKIGVITEKTQPMVKTVKRGIESKFYEVDESPEDGGRYKTQDDWFSYWSGINDGRVMMSSGDFYSVAKQLKQAYDVGTKDEKAKAERIIKSLRKDFNDRWVVLSTRLQYNASEQNPLEGKIIQHYKSNDPELIKEITLDIPVYRGTKVEDVLGQDNGLNYVQTYFDTNDDAETIMQTMEFISNKKRGGIKVWTADSDSRRTYPIRAAFLDYDDGGIFHFSGYFDLLGNFGRSRGVRLVPR